MAMLLVGYQAHDGAPVPDQLERALQATGTYWHFLSGTWIVDSDEEPAQARDRLAQLVDRRDRLLVLDVTGVPLAWKGFSREAHDWLSREL